MSEKSTGNLYFNDYKEPGTKKPDYTGWLELTRDQINALIAQGKAGKKVQLKLGCWEYPSKTNAQQSRFFIVAEPDNYEKKEKPESNGWGNTDDVPF